MLPWTQTRLHMVTTTPAGTRTIPPLSPTLEINERIRASLVVPSLPSVEEEEPVQQDENV